MARSRGLLPELVPSSDNEQNMRMQKVKGDFLYQYSMNWLKEMRKFVLILFSFRLVGCRVIVALTVNLTWTLLRNAVWSRDASHTSTKRQDWVSMVLIGPIFLLRFVHEDHTGCDVNWVSWALEALEAPTGRGRKWMAEVFGFGWIGSYCRSDNMLQILYLMPCDACCWR